MKPTLRWCGGELRRGVTLLELLVALVVIGLLLALILPAVQSARERARRLECSNNLKQIGVALHNFEASHRSFPASNNEKDGVGSWIVGLLPYLDQAPTYELTVQAYGGSLTQNANQTPDRFTDAEQILMKVALPGMHCPSDPAPAAGKTSYAGCGGTSYSVHRDDGMFRFDMGELLVDYPSGAVRAGDVSDGLSNTIAVSEWLHKWVEPVTGRPIHDTPRRSFWKLPLLTGRNAPLDVLVAECQKVPPVHPERYGWKSGTQLGESWFQAGLTGLNIYYHAMPPNTTSCNAHMIPIGTMGTAGSFHPQGVNSLYADGSVKFTANEINVAIWRALGTRAGGEIGTF